MRPALTEYYALNAKSPVLSRIEIGTRVPRRDPRPDRRALRVMDRFSPISHLRLHDRLNRYVHCVQKCTLCTERNKE